MFKNSPRTAYRLVEKLISVVSIKRRERGTENEESWLHSVRDFLGTWSPILGTTAAKSFGIFAVLAYIITRNALNEQRVATKISFDALQEARLANDLSNVAIALAGFASNQNYWAYELARAQFILAELEFCLNHPVSQSRISPIRHANRLITHDVDL